MNETGKELMRRTKALAAEVRNARRDLETPPPRPSWRSVLDGLCWGLGLGIGLPLGFWLLMIGARLAGITE